MNRNQTVLSISYVEFINKLDNLVFELLYSPQGGYTLLDSSTAIENVESYINTYKKETEKLKKKASFSNADEIIENRLNILLNKINEHYDTELINWADETYNQAIENTLTFAFSNKNNTDKLMEIYNRAISIISWIKKVKNLNDEDVHELNDEFNKKFENVINSKETDYLTKNIETKTDVKVFLKLRNLLLDNPKEFLNTDFDSFKSKLSKDDLAYFNKFKNDLSTFKKTSVMDEANLIDSAVNVLNLKSDEDKYRLIKQIDDDFNYFLYQNKTIKEDDKINIVKRRVELFGSQKENKKDLQYYTKRITSS